jgi:hypothetical protein
VVNDPDLVALNQTLKRVHYSYDLVSGNVREVVYQKGAADEFHHKYHYDADNRITNVFTSADGIIYEQDAKYFYYDHGPLARVELGHEKVQAQDYAYTIQGWLKGVNSETLLASRDMGKDGHLENDNLNKRIARDAYGYSLGYFNGDYTSSDNVPFANKTNSDLMQNRHDLYNGNISNMVTTITHPTTGTALPNAYAYKYDQLNRIVEAKAFDNLDLVNNQWQSGSTYNGRYYNQFTYDGNGNILTALAKNDIGEVIDNQTYHYQTVNGKTIDNKLYTITDQATITSGFDLLNQDDFDNENITNNNYGYTEIGELKWDKSDNIDNIKRRVDGKITEIIRTPGSGKTNLKFNYNPYGQRIAKHKYTDAGIWFESEYYVRDVTGNIMSTYKRKIDTQTQQMVFEQVARYIYGSSLVGIEKTGLIISEPIAENEHFKQIVGDKQYSLSNHLNNELVVVSDRKIGVDENADGIINYFTADIKSAKDYGIFGEYLSNRTFYPNEYPNSFNGKPDDEELFGWQDYGARNYIKGRRTFDRVDRFANKFAYQSPYSFAANIPIWAIDDNGDSVKFYSSSGLYLGYSLDNKRYANKNFLVIIDDKNIKSFQHQYELKRNAEIPESRLQKGTGKEYQEALVAGLKDMGESYEVKLLKDADKLKSAIVSLTRIENYQSKNTNKINDLNKLISSINNSIQSHKDELENKAYDTEDGYNHLGKLLHIKRLEYKVSKLNNEVATLKEVNQKLEKSKIKLEKQKEELIVN